MHASEWITLLGTVTGILTVGAGAVAKLTRLVTAVEHLVDTLEGLTKTVTDHEGRLRDLEHPDHVAPWDWDGRRR